MKKTLLLLLFIPAMVYTAKAQLGYNFSQYSLGFTYGYYEAKTDVPYQAYSSSFNFNGSYNLTPYTSFTLEFGFGQVGGGSYHYFYDQLKTISPIDPGYANAVTNAANQYLKVDVYNRSFINNYKTVTLHGDVQVGEFIDYDNGSFFNRAIRNIYVGTGIGMVYNNIIAITRTNADSTYIYGGKDHSNNVLIPVRVGYQIKHYNSYDQPDITFEVGYQMNYVFGYGLDGYADPLFTFRNYETFGGFQAGIKFNFGDYKSYRKPVH